MKVILGRKLNMTRFFEEDGTAVPVTAVNVSGCAVTQVRNRNADTVEVQLGYGKIRHLTKPLRGHLKDLPHFQYLRSFQCTAEEAKDISRGKEIPMSIFQPGDTVSVVGTSKGKGFAGVVKRHHFHGHPSTHGHKDSGRAPGSIGAGGVQRVFKGTRMAGRMGGERVSVKKLKVVKIEPEQGLMYVKGALPGARNGLVIIQG
ncbi:50S ribosomal protein L3 [Candidatus Uhrbacteria bacterium RIFCSPLOWO2_02_FULL_49_11]|uniref:50S ribosomal protein L3 n=1 Tax=Candidatus Uhrbacteria bacterium RIFCSPLOWO2_02_FULL_49_11 TaxID=1802409 RepID=A0A1F7VDY2_9BACT|nr:MAG: 50S ribosomal protein L3 [Candidatus Uhrbacteria bacterium RIFCSPLOWO2_02_FULL_49_11]